MNTEDLASHCQYKVQQTALRRATTPVACGEETANLSLWHARSAASLTCCSLLIFAGIQKNFWQWPKKPTWEFWDWEEDHSPCLCDRSGRHSDCVKLWGWWGLHRGGGWFWRRSGLSWGPRGSGLLWGCQRMTSHRWSLFPHCLQNRASEGEDRSQGLILLSEGLPYLVSSFIKFDILHIRCVAPEIFQSNAVLGTSCRLCLYCYQHKELSCLSCLFGELSGFYLFSKNGSWGDYRHWKEELEAERVINRLAK